MGEPLNLDELDADAWRAIQRVYALLLELSERRRRRQTRGPLAGRRGIARL